MKVTDDISSLTAIFLRRKMIKKNEIFVYPRLIIKFHIRHLSMNVYQTDRDKIVSCGNRHLPMNFFLPGEHHLHLVFLYVPHRWLIADRFPAVLDWLLVFPLMKNLCS